MSEIIVRPYLGFQIQIWHDQGILGAYMVPGMQHTKLLSSSFPSCVAHLSKRSRGIRGTLGSRHGMPQVCYQKCPNSKYTKGNNE